MAQVRARFVQSMAGCGLATLAACSGGGGGGGRIGSPPPPVATPTPPPATPPSPITTPAPPQTPAPPPAPTSYDTAEYRATVGSVSANALSAYDRGATGRGVKVGVVDTGIDLQSEEFGGRIDPASRDLAGNASIDDEGGHGTAVAFTIAGRRNGAGTHGIAFDASLVVLRADTPGSCASEPESTKGCSLPDSAIARGIDAAVSAGVRVINISLGGSAPSEQLVASMSRATGAGVILVMAAGNDGLANPDELTSQANNAAVARNLIVIAGSVGSGDAISSFSNRAGSSANHFLTAVGERVRAPDEAGTPYLWSGTSFAAPQIAGAVALLAQAFPNLTGAQIVTLLYASARDAGTGGVDEIYGNGVLDLTRAMAPMGTLSVAGTGAAASSISNASLSAPMGDARQGTLGALVLDGFSRAYALDLARTIDRGAASRVLTGALTARQRAMSLATADGRLGIAVTIAEGRSAATIERLQLQPDQASRAQALAASVTGRLGTRASFAIGAGEAGSGLEARLTGRRDAAFLVARDPSAGAGFDVAVGGAVAVRRAFGPWGVSVGAESGSTVMRGNRALPGVRDLDDRAPYQRATLGLDRRVGALSLGLTGTRLMERGSTLGARFSGAFGGARATSHFVDANARLNAGDGWSVRGAYRRGWTSATLTGGIGGTGAIATSAFAVDVGKDGLVGARDSIGLRVAQPLRVSRGGIDLRTPSEYSYADEQVSGWSHERLNLAPTGRELDIEGRYATPLLGGFVSTDLFWRRDPGNDARIADDLGAALRFTLGL